MTYCVNSSQTALIYRNEWCIHFDILTLFKMECISRKEGMKVPSGYNL